MTQARLLSVSLMFLLNILMFFFARPLLGFVAPNGNNENKVRILQALNILVLILQILDLIVLRFAGDKYQNYFVNIGQSLMVIYGAFFVYSFCGRFIRRRFGKLKTLDNNKVYIETYSTRMVGLIILAIISISTIYILIKIWGADSLLETTGIFGILMAFLAFTSSIWAPDIISGLIILNTQILEDGDVVILDGSSDEYIIGRVTLIYIVLYDVRNNHRTLIRNSQFTQSRIDNLSRVASTDGIRKSLLYKIGYPNLSGTTEQRQAQLSAYKDDVADMFRRAQEACQSQKDIKINEGRPFEWALTSAGDYALEYTLWVYLERLPNTKLTGTIRRHLIGTLYKVNEAVFDASVAENVDLSTPDLRMMVPTPPKPDLTAQLDTAKPNKTVTS